MTHSLRMFASIALLIMAPTTAFALTTTVDTTTQTVRVDFTGLPDYEQIRLEGVDGLSWCSGGGCDNPSSLSSTSFNANGANLEMNYEGVAPPSTNYILYYYLDGYVFKGFESVDWVVVSGEDEILLTGDRPILEPVPEPSATSLSAIAVAVVGVLAGMRGCDRKMSYAPRGLCDMTGRAPQAP
jgi:hypothetical protein